MQRELPRGQEIDLTMTNPAQPSRTYGGYGVGLPIMQVNLRVDFFLILFKLALAYPKFRYAFPDHHYNPFSV